MNHPNIAAIYGLEESGGITALVMELVDPNITRLADGAEEDVPTGSMTSAIIERLSATSPAVVSVQVCSTSAGSCCSHHARVRR